MTQQWIDGTWTKIEKKLEQVAVRSANKLPYTAVGGVHDDCSKTRVAWWTNGFWPGLLWMLFAATGKEVYAACAKQAQALLREAFHTYDELHHDVGFMWHITSGFQYRLTGDRSARLEALYAANLLAGRYNAQGEFIRAWNHNENGDTTGWAIIDSMMNIPLLYWASKETGDPRFSYIARKHADKTRQHHVREDGSVRHIVEYDPTDGVFMREYGGQGYSEGSSWSRGQAWGLYGFTLSYLYTGEPAYLNTAKRIAHYFIAATCEDWLPACDFRAPKEPVIYDATAGAIAACGLLELAGCVDGHGKELYKNAGVRLLHAMEAKCCDWDPTTDAIVTMGTERYHTEAGRHIPIIYGDYFFVEALSKLKGCGVRSW